MKDFILLTFNTQIANKCMHMPHIGCESIVYRGTLPRNTLSIESRNAICLQQFKKMIQNERTTSKSQSFEKEVCMIKNKREEFYYFRFPLDLILILF